MHIRFSMLAALCMAAACAPSGPSGAQQPANEQQPDAAASKDVYPFRVGSFQAWALKDGDLDVPNDGKTFGLGHPPSDVSALLSDAGLPTDTLHLSLEPLLVKADGRLLLFDTGAADASFAHAGRLPQSLKDAGAQPEQVTDIFISHGHADHVSGLIRKDGSLAFPKATVHISKPEWASIQADPSATTVAKAIAPKVDAFDPGSVILPGLVTAVATQGHTPGHSSYLITSGTDRLLYIGDVVHHSVISTARPDWDIAFDADHKAANAEREAMLKQAAAQGTRVYASHFPFPGLGRFKAQGDGFAWVPER